MSGCENLICSFPLRPKLSGRPRLGLESVQQTENMDEAFADSFAGCLDELA